MLTVLLVQECIKNVYKNVAGEKQVRRPKKDKQPSLPKRDPYARELEKAIYRQRRLNSAKKYTRKIQREDV